LTESIVILSTKEGTMDLSDIDAAINGARDRWGHADAQHNEDMLALIAAAEAMREKLYGPDGCDPMPVFVVKGKDLLAPDAIAAYQNACAERGLNEQARQVWLALGEVAGWQSRHPELVKLPDHPHVPVAVSVKEE
jgi:hypothetical protein